MYLYLLEGSTVVQDLYASEMYANLKALKVPCEVFEQYS